MVAAGDPGLPGQVRGRALPDDQARRAPVSVTRGELARATATARPLPTRGVDRGEADRAGLRDGGGQHVALGVGDDHEVTADDGQAAVGALVGRVADVAAADHVLGDEAVVLADLQGRGLAGDQRRAALWAMASGSWRPPPVPAPVPPARALAGGPTA